MACELGHCWKVVRRDKLTTENGTMVILFFRCKVCGFAYSSDEAELEEKDYEEKPVFESEN